MAVKQVGAAPSGTTDAATKSYVDGSIVDNGDGTLSNTGGGSGSSSTVRTPSLLGHWVGAYSGPGTGVANLGGGATTPGSTNVQGHQLAIDCTNLRIVLPYGFTISSSSTAADVPNTSSIPTKISVQVGSAVYPVTFNGQRTATCDPGGRLISDPIGGFWAAGTQLYVRILDAQAAPGAYVTTIASTGPGISPAFTNDGYTLSADLTDVTTAPANSNPTDGLWGAGIIGTPLTVAPFVLGSLGDSITAGTGDSTNSSWARRATNATVPYFSVTVPGARASGYVGAGFYSLPLLAGTTHTVVLLGTNDIGGDSATYTTVTGNLATLYKALRAEGVVPVGVTLPPRTDSSDSWATTGNQSISLPGYTGGSSSVRSQVNAWIRAGGGGYLGGYIEFADQVETARDSGIWKAGYTGDGLHPNTTGHAAAATAVSLTAVAAMH